MKRAALLSLAALCAAAPLAPSRPAQDPPPAAVDLSAAPHFPPVIDQGEIGSCDWCAVVYYQMTFLLNRRHGRAAAPENTFSPQFGYNFLNNAGSFPCNIRVDDVYRFTAKHGAATVSEVPYTRRYVPWCTDAAVWRSALSRRIAGGRSFTLRGEAPDADTSFDSYADFFHEIKRLLSGGEVLVVQSETFAGTTSRIGDDPATAEDDRFAGESIIVSGRNGPDHTVALVGYNDHVWADRNGDGAVQPEEKGALKIADSAGSRAPRRNGGFLWMAYGAAGSSLFQNRVHRMVLREGGAPGILATITLVAPERDKVRFQFGRSADSAAPPGAAPRRVFDPYGLGFEPGKAGVSLTAGGAFAFDGGPEPSEGSFVFDLSELDAGDPSDFWFLRVENAGDKPVTVLDFEITDAAGGRSVRDPGLPVALARGEVRRFVRLDRMP
jgi:hypothetical protein